jgi:hypothetical protein
MWHMWRGTYPNFASGRVYQNEYGATFVQRPSDLVSGGIEGIGAILKKKGKSALRGLLTIKGVSSEKGPPRVPAYHRGLAWSLVSCTC